MTPLECLDRVLASQAFAQADRLRELLRFLAEKSLAGESSGLRESIIGVEVFGREPGYDPKQDNIVRTSARRVRAKLDEYYAGEGSHDSMRIEMPKGSYAPVFQPVQIATAVVKPGAARPANVSSATPWTNRRRLLVLAAIASLAIGVLVYSRAKRRENQPWHSVPFATATGYESYPVFSPNGKEIAFTWNGPNQGLRQIYIQAIDGQSPRRISSEMVKNFDRIGHRTAANWPMYNGHRAAGTVSTSLLPAQESEEGSGTEFPRAMALR